MPLPMSDAKSIRAEMERVSKLREQAKETELLPETSPPASSASLPLIFRTADPQAIECVVCLGMLIWGVWLMVPGNPMVSIGLTELAPGWAWGTSILILGLSRMVGILYELGDLRRRSSYGSFFIFAMATSSCLFVPGIPGSIPIAYGIITALSAWVHIRIEK